MPSGVMRAWVLSGQRGMPPIESLPEAESQSALKRGMFCKIVADSGEADAGVGKLAKIDDNSTDLIYGIMLQDATGTEDTMLLVQPLTENVKVVMSCNGTLTSAMPMTRFEVETSTYHVVDIDKVGTSGDHTKQPLYIKKQWNSSDAAAYARVIVQLDSSFCQYNKGVAHTS